MRTINIDEASLVTGGDDDGDSTSSEIGVCDALGDALGVGAAATVLAGSTGTAGATAATASLVGVTADAVVTQSCEVGAVFIVQTVSGWIDEISDSMTVQTTGL